MKYENTKQFIGQRYQKNNHAGHVLKVGDRCKVWPTATSWMRIAYEVEIIEKEINWVGCPAIEICTHKRRGWSAVMNDNLFSRLELIVPGSGRPKRTLWERIKAWFT